MRPKVFPVSWPWPVTKALANTITETQYKLTNVEEACGFFVMGGGGGGSEVGGGGGFYPRKF